MFKRSNVFIAYAVAVPLALILGYLVSSPDSFTFAFIGTLLLFFMTPLFLRWHHFLLILFWNSVFNLYVLPGHPDVWLVLAFLSFGISFLNHVMFQKNFISAPELTRPLLVLTAIVLLTAWYRGGIGIKALGGSSNGGKYYVYIFAAVAGYFALTATPVRPSEAGKMGKLFFLSGTSAVLSNVVYIMGPAFYFVYYFVPSGAAMGQAASDVGLTQIDRISGLSGAAPPALCLLLATFGIRGIFDFSKPWRFLLLAAIFTACFFGGFRSAIASFALIFGFQFYFEGLLRTRLFPVVAGMAVCSMVPVMLFANMMPNSVQRAISFLPVNINADVRDDANGTTEWRLAMWADVWKDVPHYLLIGKGYGLDPTELNILNDAATMGIQAAGNSYETFIMAGDYHSGPLSILVPFGLFGTLAFLWVLIAGFRVLYLNYRFGETRLRLVNTALLSWFVANCVLFIFVFGAFSTGLMLFLGICGMSVSLNGGVNRTYAAKPVPIAAPEALVVESGYLPANEQPPHRAQL